MGRGTNMKILVIVLTCLLGVGAALGATWFVARKAVATAAIRDAEAAFGQGEHEKAVQLFSKALRHRDYADHGGDQSRAVAGGPVQIHDRNCRLDYADCGGDQSRAVAGGPVQIHDRSRRLDYADRGGDQSRAMAGGPVQNYQEDLILEMLRTVVPVENKLMVI